ncbi:carboxylesterase family protein [Citricoccus sp.]|uniref:carboxylesterase family protein n=1 Tax=Citricoccus sp. TaxID=1978372 RepID=UPI002CCD0B84|nr:carboxylesterase family protein [Citricoccus sp.]HRO93736.1 carboxylesterase family protein [Citricoccus sp.]
MTGPAGPVTGLDAVFRYARRADPADRFSEPAPVRRDGAASGTAETATAFPQAPGALNALLGGANGELEQSESAFQLRVQAPDGARGLPVVVFIPGGGFLSGTGNARWFTSPALVQAGQTVLVTVNYRIGALGHLGPRGDAHESQRPLRDLMEALHWVRDEIAALGGDPGNVTLAGDSAGAWYAYALAAEPRAAGLFRRLALISLPWEPPLTPEALGDRWALMSASLVDSGGLSEAPLDALLGAQTDLARAYAGRGMALMPATGGALTADLHDYAASAARLHVESLLLLSTSEEATAFLRPAPERAFPPEAVDGFLHARFEDPAAVAAWIDRKRPGASGKERMAEAMTLHQFRLAHLELAGAASGAGLEVHLGGFSVQSPLPGAGSPHCMPLPFLFGDRACWADAPMLEGLPPEVFEATASGLQEWLLGFVRDGRPRAAGEQVAPFAPEDPRRLEFDGDAPQVRVPGEAGLVARR